MGERFIIFYDEDARDRSQRKLSIVFESIELAIVHAYHLMQKGAKPVQLRGDQGTTIEGPKLKAIFVELERILASASVSTKA